MQAEQVVSTLSGPRLQGLGLRPDRGLALQLSCPAPTHGTLSVRLVTTEGETVHRLPLYGDDAQVAHELVSDGPAQDAPLLRAELAWEGPGSLAVSAEHTAQLSCLFPRDDAAFTSRFMRIEQRWGDALTQSVLMRQICRWFPGSPGYRASAAIILAYKAVEQLDDAALLEAMQWLERAEDWLRGVPRQPDPRANPEHLLQSSLAVQWHLHAIRGDMPAVWRVLERCERSVATIEHALTPALPASRSLLLLGWLRWRRGDADAAARTWLLIVDLYRQAIRRAPDATAIQFEELRHLAIMVVTAARGLAMAEGRPADPLDGEIDLPLVLAQCARVRDVALQRLTANLAA
jgi:hypothetical protein